MVFLFGGEDKLCINPRMDHEHDSQPEIFTSPSNLPCRVAPLGQISISSLKKSWQSYRWCSGDFYCYFLNPPVELRLWTNVSQAFLPFALSLLQFSPCLHLIVHLSLISRCFLKVFHTPLCYSSISFGQKVQIEVFLKNYTMVVLMDFLNVCPITCKHSF